VVPRLAEQELKPIDPQDLKIDTFRASGAGGQHVNKTSSAVRITHVPTGVVTQSQSQRSQAQNKAQALAHLSAKLQMMLEQQQAKELKELKGDLKEAAWGNQIRSYVLHPYTLVKDHRTGVQETNARAVLEGDLSAFISAP
jgi:peptide chain release factor 2